ncbi:MAG: hypothetical protein ONB44_11090 [candidate division KSB1 bacterium]|nr:hypothetical protein [candidate division KSB1 bacterium]MDZ7302669.1 hypothetical protein [candidate division KSB1 bacterium]MDZ7311801.1 hypothetical protein [candidate division KSB1 bacterium]
MWWIAGADEINDLEMTNLRNYQPRQLSAFAKASQTFCMAGSPGGR